MHEARAKCAQDKEAVEELQWAHAQFRAREQQRRRRWRRRQILRLKKQRPAAEIPGRGMVVMGLAVGPGEERE
jgi:hypothetical protein